jgi:pimeloyl-ACP methyl ester carboxylesterase
MSDFAAPPLPGTAVIALAAMGSYAAGGRQVQVTGADRRAVSLSSALSLDHDPNGTFWIDQAYVQYFVPIARRCPLPVLMIHGGGMTGRTWETTPDGRPGWLQRFVQAGFETHVVDIAERGRAGFCALSGHQATHPITRSLEEAWDLYRFGESADFASRRPFPGSRFPVDALDAFATYTVPRWPSAAPVQMEGLRRIVERIGPCVVIGHSQGGGFAVQLGAERPDLVPHVVALEPHGGDFGTSEPCTPAGKLVIVMGDYLDTSAVWSDLHGKTLRLADDWRQTGSPAEVIYLASRGLHGHSHMMMMDHGSDAIADIVIRHIFAETAPLRRDTATGDQPPIMTVSRQAVP